MALGSELAKFGKRGVLMINILPTTSKKRVKKLYIVIIHQKVEKHRYRPII